MSTTPASVNSSASASGPSSPSGTLTPVPIVPTPSPSQAPNIFNNSSLLFGFLFLIILVVFTLFALTSRFVTYRRRRLAAERAAVAPQPIQDEPPKLLDIYIRNPPAPAATWQDIKPLSAEVVSHRSALQPSGDHHDHPRLNITSNAEYLRDWLIQPVSYLWPAYFMRTRQALVPPIASQMRRVEEKHDEVMIENVDSSILESREVDVATIIMMPSPMKPSALSNIAVYENDTFDGSNLYYELGVARSSVVQSTDSHVQLS